MMKHSLVIYNKPKISSGYVCQYEALNYRHTISAVGWFDTASCELAVGDESESLRFVDNMLGNRVAVFVDDPSTPIWEGFINRLTFSAGGYQYTISLDEMVNRARTIYSNASTLNPAQSAEANITESQEIYGIKSGRIEMGTQQTATAGTAAATTTLRTTILNNLAWPSASITQGGGSGLVNIEMLGFWHTLTWDIWNDATNALSQATTLINTVLLPGIANGSTFFDNTDTSDVDSNVTTILRHRLRGQTMQEILSEITESGISTGEKWVVGITPTDQNTNTRKLYYRAFNPTIEYTARMADGLRIRNTYGGIERPWTVVPDRGIRISDMLLDWSGLGDDPTETWIAAIDYSANEGTVSWTGADDTTVEGGFQLNRYNRKHGMPFGAERRVV